MGVGDVVLDGVVVAVGVAVEVGDGVGVGVSVAVKVEVAVGAGVHEEMGVWLAPSVTSGVSDDGAAEPTSPHPASVIKIVTTRRYSKAPTFED